MERMARTLAFAGLMWIAPIATTHAQEAPPPDDEAELTDEEMRLLMEGLEADTKATSERTSTPAPAGAGVFQGISLDIALILDVALAWYTDDSRMLGAHDPAANGFNLQQLELSAGAAVDPYFRFDTNIVFALFGVELEEAYGTTLGLPASLQVRLGQFLTRFGRMNPTHPHSWDFVDQPLIFGKMFGSEGNRGLGMELSWLAPLPWYAELVGSVNTADGDCCARSYLGGSLTDVETPLDLLYTVALKQFFGPDRDWGIFWGLSAQFGPNATGNGNRTEIYGTDLYIRYRPVDDPDRMSLSFTLEALFRTRQVPFGVVQDAGGYASLVWQIDPRWALGARYELVTGADDDPLDPDWDSLRQRAELQATYYPSHFSRVRLQLVTDHDGSFVWGGVLAVELVAGAHGAHNY